MCINAINQECLFSVVFGVRINSRATCAADARVGPSDAGVSRAAAYGPASLARKRARF